MTPSILELVASCFYTAFLAAATFIVFHKWGLITRLQVHAKQIFGVFHEVAGCEFCLLFWTCFIITLPLIFSASMAYIACPLPAAALAKFIYEGSKNKGGGLS